MTAAWIGLPQSMTDGPPKAVSMPGCLIRTSALGAQRSAREIGSWGRS
jgi:hypothetical protein